MPIYQAQPDGKLKEIDPSEESIIQSDNVVIIVSDTHRKTYVWVGSAAGIRLKFTGAREAQKLRMQTGYKIVNVEEGDDTTEIFKALEAEHGAPRPPLPAGGGSSHQPREKTEETAAETKEPSQSISSPPSRKERPSATTVSPQPRTERKTRQPSKDEYSLSDAELERMPLKKLVSLFYNGPVSDNQIALQRVLDRLHELPPVEGQIRDYVVISGKIYYLPHTKKSADDMKLAQIQDGAFYGEHYHPRFLVIDGKLVAIELWRYPRS